MMSKLYCALNTFFELVDLVLGDYILISWI